MLEYDIPVGPNISWWRGLDLSGAAMSDEEVRVDDEKRAKSTIQFSGPRPPDIMKSETP